MKPGDGRLDLTISAVRNSLKLMPLSLQACSMYFAWAGHMARLDQSCAIKQILEYKGLFWFRFGQQEGLDRVGQPRARLPGVGRPSWWEHDLEEFAGLGWTTDCQHRETWARNKHAMSLSKWYRLLAKPARPIDSELQAMAHTSPKIKAIFPNHRDLGIQVLMVVDNMQVAAQTNGTWSKPANVIFQAAIARMRWLCHCLRTLWKVTPWTGFRHFFLQRPRAENTLADAVGKYAMDVGAKTWYTSIAILPGDRFVISSDGARRGSGACSCAAAITLYRNLQPPAVVAACALPLCQNTNVEAGFEGAVLGLLLFVEVVRRMVFGDADFFLLPLKTFGEVG